MAKRPTADSKKGPEAKKQHTSDDDPTDDIDDGGAPNENHVLMGPFEGLPNEILVRVLVYCGPHGTASWGATCRAAACLLWGRDLSRIVYRDAVGAMCDSLLCLGRLCNVVDPGHLANGGGPSTDLRSTLLHDNDGGGDSDGWWGPCGRLVSSNPWADGCPLDPCECAVASNHRGWACGHLPPSLVEVTGPLASWAISCALTAPEDVLARYERDSDMQPAIVARLQAGPSESLQVEWGMFHGAEMEGPGLTAYVDARHIDVQWAVAWSTKPIGDATCKGRDWRRRRNGRRVRPRPGYASVRLLATTGLYEWIDVPLAVQHTMPTVADWHVWRSAVVCESASGSRAARVATRGRCSVERQVEHWCAMHPLENRSGSARLTGPGMGAIRAGSYHCKIRSDALKISSGCPRDKGADIDDMVRPRRNANSEIEVASEGTTLRFVGYCGGGLAPSAGAIYVRKCHNGTKGVDPWGPAVVTTGWRPKIYGDLCQKVELADDEGNQIMRTCSQSRTLEDALIVPTSESAIDIRVVGGAPGAWWPIKAIIRLGDGLPMLWCGWERVRPSDPGAYRSGPPTEVLVRTPDDSYLPATLIVPLDPLDDHQHDLVETAWDQRVADATQCSRAFFGVPNALYSNIGHILAEPAFRFAVWTQGADMPITVDWTPALIGTLHRTSVSS